MANKKGMEQMARAVIGGVRLSLEKEKGEIAIRLMYEFSMIFTIEAHRYLGRLRRERKACLTTEPS